MRGWRGSIKIVKSPDPDLDTIHEAIRLRGLFVHRYSGIEFAVSELIIRARDHSHYNHLGDLPKPWEKKRKRLETLLEHDGPIKAYSAPLKTSFRDFDSFEAKRHFLVHALMTIPRDSENRTKLAFSMYDHRPVDEAGARKSMVHAGRLEMKLEELDALVASLQPISTNFTALVARICREVPLPVLKIK